MTPTEVTDILRQFNGWRRDFEDKFEQPDPREISEAIDAAIEMIERLAALPARITPEQAPASACATTATRPQRAMRTAGTPA